MVKSQLLTLVILLCCGACFALEPAEILIIANSDIKESVQLAEYYCQKRGVPTANILALHLGTNLNDNIKRNDYEKLLAAPIRYKLFSGELTGKIKCLLTTYGVPIKVGKRGQLTGQQKRLQQLQQHRQRKKDQLQLLKLNTSANLVGKERELNRQLSQLQGEIDYIVGKETNASVDSELSMVLAGNYELYKWQLNKLKNRAPYWDFKTLMVCRLDGPGFKISQGLVDKAIAAEKTGLIGIAYIDSRGVKNDNKPYSFGYFDKSLHDLSLTIKTKTQLPVVEERTSALFGPGQCPYTAIYCGWYSLKKYIDAFDFVDGAIGYHIASWEAMDIRDPNSTQWCPAMLVDGITATIGAVAEPYLRAFPEPDNFFAELLNGRCLVEAYYRTKPFNSWQLVLIGDPLYTPFKKN